MNKKASQPIFTVVDPNEPKAVEAVLKKLILEKLTEGKK